MGYATMSSALPATLAQVTISDPMKVSGFGKTHQPPLELNHFFTEFLRRLIPSSPARKRTPVRLKPPGASTAVVIDDAWYGKAKAAYWRTTMAEYHLTQDQIIEAGLEWKQTLGRLFPVLGENTAAMLLFPAQRRKASAA